MDDTSPNRMFDGKSPEEGQLNLLKLFSVMQENLRRAERSVEISKDVLTECRVKLEEMSSQVEGLKFVVEEGNSNKQETLGTREEIQRKNPSKRSIEEITLEESQESLNTPEATNYENQQKKQKINLESCGFFSTTNNGCIPGPLRETPKIIRNNYSQGVSSVYQDDYCKPGPSQENPKITRNNYSQAVSSVYRDDHCKPGPSQETTRNNSQGDQSLKEKESFDTTGTYCTEDVGKRSQEKEISEEELQTFLYLSDQVDDPVVLATSFTSDVEKIYLKLKNYHSRLKAENERTASSSNKNLEVKVQLLIQMFLEASPKITENNRSQDEHSTNEEVADVTEVRRTEDVVETAIRNSKEVLSQEEFKTFLFLSDQVEDPVELATLFTSDLKRVYLQLMTFHFHLKDANDTVEKEHGASSSSRDLENKVKRLTQRFQAVVGNSDLPSTDAIAGPQTMIQNLRRDVALRDHLQRFFNRH